MNIFIRQVSQKLKNAHPCVIIRSVNNIEKMIDIYRFSIEALDTYYFLEER
jgi:hypothetical protein